MNWACRQLIGRQFDAEARRADSAKDLAEEFARLKIVDERAQRFRDKILAAVTEEAKKLPKGKIGLASSD